MPFPPLKEEKKLWQKGYKYVIGVDEAGRGALAGPVVVAAVLIKPKIKFKNKIEIRDSKKMSARKREEVFQVLSFHPQIVWSVGWVTPKIIDRINILEATKLAGKRAVERLLRSHLPISSDNIFLLIDGDFKLNLNLPQKSIVKGDEKVASCMIASILAKVSRDRIMRRLHEKYPQYRFDKHKGYPTTYHLKMLKKYKPSEVHRRSFKPVNEEFAGRERCFY